MPIQSCGQSVSAPRGKAGDRLNAHTELRAKRQRSAREAIYRNRPTDLGGVVGGVVGSGRIAAVRREAGGRGGVLGVLVDRQKRQLIFVTVGSG